MPRGPRYGFVGSVGPRRPGQRGHPLRRQPRRIRGPGRRRGTLVGPGRPGEPQPAPPRPRGSTRLSDRRPAPAQRHQPSHRRPAHPELHPGDRPGNASTRSPRNTTSPNPPRRRASSTQVDTANPSVNFPGSESNPADSADPSFVGRVSGRAAPRIITRARRSARRLQYLHVHRAGTGVAQPHACRAEPWRVVFLADPHRQ